MRRVRKKPMASINVVPYIDVMLVLLIIFMITTPILEQGVKVNLPKGKTQSLSEQKQEPIIVTIDQKGNYYLNIMDQPDVPLTSNQLVLRVAAEMKIAKEKGWRETILVRGDRDVSYGKVVRTMVLLQQAGIEKVGLMTEHQDES